MLGCEVPAEQAIRLVTEILESPIRVIDTSNESSDRARPGSVNDKIDAAYQAEYRGRPNFDAMIDNPADSVTKSGVRTTSASRSVPLRTRTDNSDYDVGPARTLVKIKKETREKV